MNMNFPWKKPKPVETEEMDEKIYDEYYKEEMDEKIYDEYYKEEMDEKIRVKPKFIDTTKKREFLVGHTTDVKTGQYLSFFVTDVFDDAELQSGTRPEIATFPVSTLYDAHEQKQRAEKYCEYMNRINDAKQKVYEQTLLMDIMREKI